MHWDHELIFAVEVSIDNEETNKQRIISLNQTETSKEGSSEEGY